MNIFFKGQSKRFVPFESAIYLGFSLFLFFLALISQFPAFCFDTGILLLLMLAFLFLSSLFLLRKGESKLKNRLRLFLRIVFILLLFFFLVAFFIFYILPIEGLTSINTLDSQFEKESLPRNLIILGGGIDRDHHPGAALKKRLELGVQVNAKIPPFAQIYVTGGLQPFRALSEGEVMKAWLTEEGVDPKRIIVENRATSSWENLQYIKELNPQILQEPTILISSRFHLFRVAFLAKRAGYEELFFMGARSSVNHFFPTLIRESIAVVKSFLFDL